MEIFKKEFKRAAIDATRKIIPSYFKQIKYFYSSKIKASAIEAIFLDMTQRLEDKKGFEQDSPSELPTCVMFLKFILGHHYLKTGQLETALKYAEDCKTHTPTFVENYMLLAKIHKAMLNYPEASEAILDGFNLDRADRYPCNKSSKYLLRENRINEADILFKTFMKDDKKNEGNVHELQKSFYELPVALAYLRQNKWGRGLRLLDFIYGHFKAIDEEQLEFFSYALRKYSMINFMKMVRLNIIDVGKNPYFIMGNANYLKYAMAYQRKLAVEAKINEVPKKVKNHELKKQKKLKDKFDSANAVDASEEVVKNLDLNGENLLNNLKLADIAKMVAICQPANDK